MSLSLFNIISTLGIVAILTAFLYVGKKLQILESMDECMRKIKTNVNVITLYLTRHHAQFNPSELQTLSPFQLTPTGEDFIKSIGFDTVFAQHESDFFAFVDSEQVRLKYDVETAAIKSIYGLYEKPFMEFLKIFFYNHPDRNLENTASALGVYVRDKYLAKHPGITQ